MREESLFSRVNKFSDSDRIALLFRLWGFLESHDPEFNKGLEIFVPQLEEEARIGRGDKK